MFCPKCGNDVKEEAAFCPKCGYAFSARLCVAEGGRVDTSEGDETLNQASPKRPSPVRYIVVAFLLFTVAFGVFHLIGEDEGGIDTTAENNRQPESGVSEEVQPKNLEEWVALNDPDLLDRIRSKGLEYAAAFDPYDAKIWVDENQLNLVYYMNANKQGVVDSLLGSMLNDVMDAATEGQWMSDYARMAAQLEQKSGLNGIRCHLEIRYRDGSLSSTYDFTSSGRIN